MNYSFTKPRGEYRCWRCGEKGKIWCWRIDKNNRSNAYCKTCASVMFDDIDQVQIKKSMNS